MIALRLVDHKIGGGEHRAEKQPGAMRAADEIGVLALPAEPGRCRQRLFHHRRGIDEDLDVLASSAPQSAWRSPSAGP